MSNQLEELKSKIREILSEIEEEDELKKEVTTTGDVAGYDTPRAFSSDGKHKDGYVKRMAGLTGYSAVNESTNPSDIIKDLDKVKNDLIKKVDVLIAKKKKLYSDVDITTPMSADEKQLDKDIQSIFSQIQQLIQQKRKIKTESITESNAKKDIEKLTSYNDLFKFFKDNKSKLNKKYTNDIEDEIGALKYLESDYKRGDADREEVLVAIEEIQDLIKKSLDIKESELKGYLAADVVDDIVKTIGSKFVKGHVENAPNRNYIYLKLTDIKFGDDVVKMLKSKFGIDAKVDKTFGNQPTVSFASKKVISEEKVYIDFLNKEKGFKQDRIKFNSYEDAVKWARKNFDKFSPDMIKYESVNEATLTEKKYYVTYNKGRGQGKGLEKEFDQKTFSSTNKPKVFNSYNDAKKYSEKMEKMFRNSIGGGTAYWVSDEKMNPINENRFQKLRLDQTMTPNQKIGLGVREIRRKIDEIEKFLEWYGKIKKENSLKGENFWKRTNHHIYRIKERLSNIGKNVTTLRK